VNLNFSSLSELALIDLGDVSAIWTPVGTIRICGGDFIGILLFQLCIVKLLEITFVVYLE